MRRLRALVALLLPTAVLAQPVGTQTPDDPTPTTDDPENPYGPPPGSTSVPGPVAPAEEPSFSAVDHQYRTVTTERHETFFSEYGFALTAGGGVSGFTDATARDATRDGGGWDVRATIGTKLPVAAEVSYLGSAQRIDALGLDNNAMLVGNGVQADVRLNVMTGVSVQPFIYAGAAWRRYDVTNTSANTSDVASSDNVVEFPVGVGFAYRRHGLILDARGEFRPATNEDLMPALRSDTTRDANQASLHRWGVNANIGYEF